MAVGGTLSPFNITAGNATMSPWNATAPPADSTTNSTTIIPADTTANATASPLSPPSDLTPIQLTIANGCGESIWPGILTQYGIGPATGGFELTAGTSRMMFVSADWAGRIWGRTNCSFNSDGSGPSTQRGVNGYGAACLTGDCLGRLDCQLAGQVPTTLAEFTLQGGSTNSQTFYDISLVDGYNLPLAIIHHPAANATWIPPNLTNCACIASPGYLTSVSDADAGHQQALHALQAHHHHHHYSTNATYPVPYEPSETHASLETWCPLPLLLKHLAPLPRDSGPRPAFQPCLSPCSATGAPADCCTGRYNSPSACAPSAYSRRAKRACPDAYSFAYDDRASTFVVPSAAALGEGPPGTGGAGGWEVRFCPRGRSTDILGTFGEELRVLASGGTLSREGWGRVRDRHFVEGAGRRNGAGTGTGPGTGTAAAGAVVGGVDRVVLVLGLVLAIGTVVVLL